MNSRKVETFSVFKFELSTSVISQRFQTVNYYSHLLDIHIAMSGTRELTTLIYKLGDMALPYYIMMNEAEDKGK